MNVLNSFWQEFVLFVEGVVDALAHDALAAGKARSSLLWRTLSRKYAFETLLAGAIIAPLVVFGLTLSIQLAIVLMAAFGYLAALAWLIRQKA